MPKAADDAMRGGVKRLLQLSLKEQMKQLERSMRAFDAAALQLRGVASAEAIKSDVLNAIVDRAFIGEDALPRTEREFEARRARARTRLPAVIDAAGRLLADIAAEYQKTMQRLSSIRGPLARPAADIKLQLSRLVYDRFFSATPWPQLAHLPRYLRAMHARLDKYGRDPARDAKHTASIEELWKRYEQRLEQQRRSGSVDPRLEDFRWQLEELRVSLFAQELKTPQPVSYKRLDKFWNAMR